MEGVVGGGEACVTSGRVVVVVGEAVAVVVLAETEVLVVLGFSA